MSGPLHIIRYVLEIYVCKSTGSNLTMKSKDDVLVSGKFNKEWIPTGARKLLALELRQEPDLFTRLPS